MFAQNAKLYVYPNVIVLSPVARVLDKSHSDTKWRFARASVQSVMYTGLHMNRHSAPEVGPILAVKCIWL